MEGREKGNAKERKKNSKESRDVDRATKEKERKKC
jgi:hypothetical protein